MMPQKLRVIKTLGKRGGFKNGQEASGHVSVQEDSFNHGNRYTSKSILIAYLLLYCSAT